MYIHYFCNVVRLEYGPVKQASSCSSSYGNAFPWHFWWWHCDHLERGFANEAEHDRHFEGGSKNTMIWRGGRKEVS